MEQETYRPRESDIESLFISYMPWVRSLARALAGRDSYLQDDLIQEGLIALYRATQRYDPERGPFPPFARSCVRNAMISFLRKNTLHRAEESFDEIEELAKPSALDDEPRGAESQEMLKELIPVLSPMETAALDAYLQTGGTAQAAKVLGWDEKRVYNALQRVRNKVKALFVSR